MILADKIDVFSKKNNDFIVVGCDLEYEFAQLSFYHVNGEQPETISTVTGMEEYNIPMVLCKRVEVNQWFYGKEAIKNAKEGEGILIEHLLELALDGIPIVIEETEFDPVNLLSLFIKRSVSMLSMWVPVEKIAGFMITVDKMDKRMAEVLLKATSTLPISPEKIFFESHEESIFYYMMNQKQELWNSQVGICDYSDVCLKTYRLELNRKTIPMVGFMDKKEYSEIKFPVCIKPEPLDELFLEVCEQLCQDRTFSSIFLIGEGFHGEWNKKSLRFLCNKRRIFQGNNLYSKGACYAVRERVIPTEISKRYVFLGKDKLKSNLGMRVVRKGEETYFAILDAGTNWFDAKREVDFMMESGNTISIVVTPLNEHESKKADIYLSGLPMRPKRATRIHMELSMQSSNTVRVKIVDLGFGEIYKASGLEWTEEFELS